MKTNVTMSQAGMNLGQLKESLKIISQVKSAEMGKKYVTFMEITWDSSNLMGRGIGI